MKRTMLGLICTQILFLAACGSINTSNTINVNDEKDGYEETVTSEIENDIDVEQVENKTTDNEKMPVNDSEKNYEETEVDNSLVTLIADFLKESESDFFPKLKYGFHDIDLDGKKELLMAGSDSHVNRVKVIRIDYDNNELIDLGDYGCWGCIQYSSENGYIDDCYTGQGVTEGTIYDISTNSPRKVLEYYDDSSVDEDESNDVYILNGKEVSREEYEGEIFFSLQIHDYSQLVNIGYDDFDEDISLDILKERIENGDCTKINEFKEFLNNEEPVYFDLVYNKFNFYEAEGQPFEGDRPYLYDDFKKIFREKCIMPADETEYYRSRYAYIDVGNDGDEELVLRLDDGSTPSSKHYWILKRIDGKLQVIFYTYEVDRLQVTLNKYGVLRQKYVTLSSENEEWSYVDKDGNYNLFYGKDTYFMPHNITTENDEDFLAKLEENGLLYYMNPEMYYFDYCEPDETLIDYSKRCMWNYHKAEHISFEEEIYQADNIYGEIWEMTGYPIYSDGEIQNAINKRAEELGITEEILAGTNPEWILVEAVDGLRDN